MGEDGVAKGEIAEKNAREIGSDSPNILARERNF